MYHVKCRSFSDLPDSLLRTIHSSILPAEMSVNFPPGTGPRSYEQWQFVGLTSSFPDLSEGSDLSQARPCNGVYRPGCKVFADGVEVPEKSWNGEELGNQVLVFQYRGKFFATEHVRSHSRPDPGPSHISS